VPLNVAVTEKSPAFYGNCQPIPRRKTWSGKSVAVLGAAYLVIEELVVSGEEEQIAAIATVVTPVRKSLLC